MADCRDVALKQYEALLTGPEDNAARSARQQRIHLLAAVGRGEEAVREEKERLEQAPEDPARLLSMAAALYWAGRYGQVLEVFQRAREVLGEPGAPFNIYAGDACAALARYEDAAQYWEKALELDPEAADPLYSQAECLHRQGLYAQETLAWERVIDWLAKRGYVHELRGPRERLGRARELAGM